MKKIISIAVVSVVMAVVVFGAVCFGFGGCHWWDMEYRGPDYFAVIKIPNFKVEYELPGSFHHESETYDINKFTEIKVDDTVYFKQDGKEASIFKKTDPEQQRRFFGDTSGFCRYANACKNSVINKKSLYEFKGEETFIGRTIKIYQWTNQFLDSGTNEYRVIERTYFVDKEFNIALKSTTKEGENSWIDFEVTSLIIGNQVLPQD